MKFHLVGPGLYRGWKTTQLYRDYFINHEIRIPSLTNQDDSWKVFEGFFRGSNRIALVFPVSLEDPQLHKKRHFLSRMGCLGNSNSLG